MAAFACGGVACLCPNSPRPPAPVSCTWVHVFDHAPTRPPTRPFPPLAFSHLSPLSHLSPFPTLSHRLPFPTVSHHAPFPALSHCSLPAPHRAYRRLHQCCRHWVTRRTAPPSACRHAPARSPLPACAPARTLAPTRSPLPARPCPLARSPLPARASHPLDGAPLRPLGCGSGAIHFLLRPTNLERPGESVARNFGLQRGHRGQPRAVQGAACAPARGKSCERARGRQDGRRGAGQRSAHADPSRQLNARHDGERDECERHRLTSLTAKEKEGKED